MLPNPIHYHCLWGSIYHQKSSYINFHLPSSFIIIFSNLTCHDFGCFLFYYSQMYYTVSVAKMQIINFVLLSAYVFDIFSIINVLSSSPFAPLFIETDLSDTRKILSRMFFMMVSEVIRLFYECLNFLDMCKPV